MVKKILFVNGPSQDPSDRFFGWPTSLLYAIAPTIKAIDGGGLNLEYDPKIFEPLWYVERENNEQIKSDFKERIKNIDIVCASATYDSLYPTLQLFTEAKRVNPNIVTIFGGPYFDEVHHLQSSEVKNHNLIDFAIAWNSPDKVDRPKPARSIFGFHFPVFSISSAGCMHLVPHEPHFVRHFVPLLLSLSHNHFHELPSSSRHLEDCAASP